MKQGRLDATIDKYKQRYKEEWKHKLDEVSIEDDGEIIMLSFADYKDRMSKSIHYHIENNMPFTRKHL